MISYLSFTALKGKWWYSHCTNKQTDSQLIHYLFWWSTANNCRSQDPKPKQLISIACVHLPSVCLLSDLTCRTYSVSEMTIAGWHFIVGHSSQLSTDLLYTSSTPDLVAASSLKSQLFLSIQALGSSFEFLVLNCCQYRLTITQNIPIKFSSIVSSLKTRKKCLKEISLAFNIIFSAHSQKHQHV